MKIAVVSDLHAYNSKKWKKDDSPSHYDIANPGPGDQCPMVSLHEFIRKNSLKADALLCPGDVTNQACSDSLQIAWKAIAEAKKLLGASSLVATVGNHDVDSRGKHNKYDPIAGLKSLTPKFPISRQNLRNEFWANHFFIWEQDDCRILVVNSSAYHNNKHEVQHGRVADTTRKEIEKKLDKLDPKPINLLLCHHNPDVHSELKLGEHDQIVGGQLLIDVLAKPNRGQWLVIHGHKHHPKLAYAAGGSMSPTLFSAGSIASTLYKTLRMEAGNQFYILSFDKDEISKRGLVGKFQSWNWHKGLGWVPATNDKGLPATGGFGHRENPELLAQRIARYFSTRTRKYLSGTNVYEKFPNLEYMIPNDLKGLAKSMKAIGATLEFAEDGRINELSVE